MGTNAGKAEPEVPEAINVVLTFADGDGRRWLAGAALGPLVAEGDTEETIAVDRMPDLALTLVNFTVVHRG